MNASSQTLASSSYRYIMHGNKPVIPKGSTSMHRFTTIALYLFASLFTLIPISLAEQPPAEDKPLVKPGFNIGCTQKNTPQSMKEIRAYWLKTTPILQERIPFFETAKTRPLFKIVVQKSGKIQTVSVLKHSDSPELDKKAVEAMTALESLPALPESFPFNLDSQVVFYKNLSLPKEEAKFTPEQERAVQGIITAMQRQIKKTWHPPRVVELGEKKTITTIFTLDLSTRQIFNPKIIVSSCDLEFDAAALKAIHHANPLSKKLEKEIRKLPESTQKGTWDIEFMFDIESKPARPFYGAF